MARTTLSLMFLIAATSTFADDSLRFVRVRGVEGAVMLQRGDETSEPAGRDVPLLPGDRLLTAEQSRAELLVTDGTLLSLDQDSQLDYANEGEDQEGSFLELQLGVGSLYFDGVAGQPTAYSVETPDGRIDVASTASCRVDVGRDETRLAVLAGEAVLVGARGSVAVAQGEYATVSSGRRPSAARALGRLSDAFARWHAARVLPAPRWAHDEKYLPGTLWPFAAELEQYGRWVFSAELGRYVWRPSVAADWQPFVNGRWYWTVDGWAWVADEPWGWAPYHYGRWAYLARLGWAWVPGDEFALAWVVWDEGDDYVGWAPWFDGPYDGNSHQGWIYAHRHDFRSHGFLRCRISITASGRGRGWDRTAHLGHGLHLGPAPAPRHAVPRGQTPMPPSEAEQRHPAPRAVAKERGGPPAQQAERDRQRVEAAQQAERDRQRVEAAQQAEAAQARERAQQEERDRQRVEAAQQAERDRQQAEAAQARERAQQVEREQADRQRAQEAAQTAETEQHRGARVREQ